MMSVYDVNGNRIWNHKQKLCGAVLDATSETNRFLAMKQLFDIAEKIIHNPSYIPEASDFTYATKGCVCILPESSSFYEQYPIVHLFAKNADVQGVPASTTKVMSLVTGAPFVASIMDKVTLVSGDIESGSGNYFSAGDILTVEDLMYGMLLPSSNTCAKTFAHYVGAKILNNSSASVSDCITAFVAEMNRRAGLLGCSNSTFTTPSGLSTTNFSTASDLIRITIAASSIPEIVRIWNKKEYDVNVKGSNARTQHLDTTVTNATLENDYFIFGGKTGHIIATPAPNALVMVAEAK